MSVRVECPGCGGAVVFAVGTALATVCPYCRSVVARGDRSVENLGKVAELVETGALLKVGLTGKFHGRPFELTGRTQLKHEAGGVWDEWYASFSDGTWGWMAEAQGRFYLTFANPKAKDLPGYADLRVGADAGLPPAAGKYVVAEKGTATIAGAEGSLPYRLEPGSTYQFADLSGPKETFATLDYGDNPPNLFTGKQVTLDELGFPPDTKLKKQDWELKKVGGKQLKCPQCAGPLELRAPDKTERVGCPNCGAMIDCAEGDLKLLSGLENASLRPLIPLGAVGKFPEGERTCIAMLRRSVTFDGVNYPWDEYLLYHPRDGFEWLINSDGQWTRAKAVNVGDVSKREKFAQFDGRNYTLFQRSTATVRGVIGECYWRVAIGETVEAADFISPPYSLSREVSFGDGDAKEVNWTRGEYQTPEAITAAFALKKPLPPERGIAPNKPFPYKGIYPQAFKFVALLALLGVLFSFYKPQRLVYEKTLAFAPPAEGDANVAVHSDKFTLRDTSNIRLSLSGTKLPAGQKVSGELVPDEGLARSIDVALNDTRAGPAGSTTVSAPSTAGTHSLTFTLPRDVALQAGELRVKVEQGVSRTLNWILACLALLALPFFVMIYHLYFNTKRWENSGGV